MSKTSYIRGKAEVIFGGSIKILCGTNHAGECLLAFSELKEQMKVGEHMGDADSYDPQVFFVFDNLDSVTIVRDALECIEKYFKEGEFGEPMKKIVTQ